MQDTEASCELGSLELEDAEACESHFCLKAEGGTQFQQSAWFIQ